MNKKIVIIIFAISLVLTSIYFLFLKKDEFNYQIDTIVEDNKKYVISITVPKTNIRKLDNEIKGFIDDRIKSFKDNNYQTSYLLERNELNIDFDFNFFNDRYISIGIKETVFDGKKKENKYLVQTYLYDLDKNKFINILDLFDNHDDLFLDVKNKIFNEFGITVYNFDDLDLVISDNNLIVYFIRDNLYSVSISLKDLNFKLPITSNEEVDSTILTEDVINVIDPSKPVVAITFDDGPSQYTEEIIKTLKDNDCNATFFVLGNKVEAYQDVIKQSIKDGNEIGNHSYNHKWLSRLSTDEVKEQIDKTQNILKETVGYTPTLLRPTYESVNQRIRKNTDLDIVLWTIDTKDWKIKSSDRIVEKIVKSVSDGDIILMHDIFKRSSDALKKLIPILKEQGYQFVTISELEEVKLLRTKF